MIFEGRPAGKCAVPNKDDEWRKLIKTLAFRRRPCSLRQRCRQVRRPVTRPALTADRWQDRLLGSNQQIDVPLRIVWFATSQQCHTFNRHDLPESAYSTRKPVGAPEERSDFRHPNLLQHVKQKRPRLVMAAVDLTRLPCRRPPESKLYAVGQFRAVVRSCASAVVWSGLPDPAETRGSSPTMTAKRRTGQLLQGWAEMVFPQRFTAQCNWSKQTEKYPMLRAAVNELTAGRHDRTRSLPTLLRDAKGRVIDGRAFTRSDLRSPSGSSQRSKAALRPATGRRARPRGGRCKSPDRQPRPMHGLTPLSFPRRPPTRLACDKASMAADAPSNRGAGSCASGQRDRIS